MSSLTDQELLREYAERRAEPAFTELVQRHVDFVYSAALRMVRDAQLAQDVTQGVFIALASNARQLTSHPTLSGWLHRTAQHLAANAVRTDVRRRNREQEAAAMNELLSPAHEIPWEHLAPHLDAALGALAEADRDAILLRYFEKKSAQEMADILNVSPEAAQKRVNRAVDRLRELFTRRGITVSTGGLVVLLSANAIQAAPVGLAAAIAAAALAGTTIATSSTLIAATKTVTMTTLQKAVITATLAAAIGAGVHEARQASRLRTEADTLQQQQAPLFEQIQTLQRERDTATNRLASMIEHAARSNADNAELLRLRGELGPLKQRLTELSNQVARAQNLWGLLPEETPPVTSSGVGDTARGYARLVKKLAAGHLSAADEFNLAKAWPYLERRFSEPDAFGFFQAEYLAAMLELKDDNAKWQLRRILEKARDEEHAQGLRWARMTEEEIQKTPISAAVQRDIQNIRDQWNALNQKTVQQITQILPEDQRAKFSATWSVLDFDPSLKSGSKASLTDPRFQNLTPEELFQSFAPPNPNVQYVPATVIQGR